MALATTTTRTPTVIRCPVCGGLECLCRPRFFAGQLLTEDDLNRLERYIIDKNRLHNRYLVGWGVVCGLEVLCNPCKGFVTLTAGYALSPCGDDIVVCRDATVNVCELIQDCREHQWQCDPAFPRPDPICTDKDEQWILYLCYDEKATRGVVPLHGASGAACCSSCSCGGSSSCGCRGGSGSSSCGCGGGGSKTSCGCGSTGLTKTGTDLYQQARRKTPPQCEPTITCEGYSFRLRKETLPSTKRDLGEWFNRIVDCIEKLSQVFQAVQGLPNSSNPQGQVQAIKATLLLFIEAESISSCGLRQRIVDVDLPDGAAPPPITVIQQRFERIIFDLARECLCSSLLPPCPGPADDNCVPIATLTLNCKDGCNVVRICNLEHRKMVVTWPIVQYYLGGFFKLLNIPELLQRFCCADDIFRRGTVPGIAAAPVDPIDQIFRDIFRSGSNVDRRQLFKRIGELVQDIPSRFLNKLGGTDGPEPN